MKIAGLTSAGLVLLALIMVIPSPALATNGMYLAGYGAEAQGRGGANIAVADRALGLQSNPAGIAQLMGNHLSVDFQFLMPKLSYYGDPLGNSIDAENQTFIMPSISYVRGGKDSRWTWGVGLLSQGGMGAHFKGYVTPFGSVDETYSQVRFLTLNPTVAYNVTPDLSLGLSLNVGYSDVRFRFYPETSVYVPPGTPNWPPEGFAFFGANLSTAAQAFNYSARLGLMWRVNEMWQIGAIYQSETKGDFEDGTLYLDMSSIGLGKVGYDAAVDGFTWPEQYGIGVQFRPGEKWVLALDVKRYNWSKAIEVITVEGKNPDTDFAPADEVQMPFVFKWEDQTVWALGLEYRLSPALTLRGGYNHGDSPVPDETLNPLFPATVEDHASAGLSYTWKGNTLNFALERGFENTQTNNNPDPNVNPFGPGATVSHSQWTLAIGYSLAF